MQVVMDMDGWGDKTLKRSTYLRYIYAEPVEFTGLNCFIKMIPKKAQPTLFTQGIIEICSQAYLHPVPIILFLL